MRRLSAPRRVRCARAKRAQRTRPEQASGTIRRMDLARNTKYVIRPMQMRTESAQRAAQRVPAIWAALDQRARFGRGHRMYPVTQCADWQREAERVLHQVLHMWRGL